MKQADSNGLTGYGDSPNWEPTPLCPRHEWLDYQRLRFVAGRLAGRVFEVGTEHSERRASIYLAENGERIGQCLVDRDPPGEGVVLWDIGVRPHLRRSGLCATMAWLIFRELIEAQDNASFRIRMVTSVRAGEQTGLQNVGICIVANRLGMTTDFDLDRLLARKNVTGIELFPEQDGSPMGLKVAVREYPLVVLGVALDPDSRRPMKAFRVYQQLERDPELVRDWARRGMLVVTNGDFSLRAGGVNRFVNSLATEPVEAAKYRARIRPLP